MENEEMLEVQDTFNEDGLDVLVEDGTVENVEEFLCTIVVKRFAFRFCLPGESAQCTHDAHT